MKQGRKDFAPETALGTGAAEPVVDEYEAAKEVWSVDESTVKGGSQNQPGRAGTIAYSNETHVEATKDLGQEPAENDTNVSNGEDYETANKDDDTLAGAGVDSAITGDQVNSKAEDVRPDVPQATKATKKRSTV